jgi:glycerate kinase
MRALIAFDKFKNSLSAPEACALAADALAATVAGFAADLCPLTDGGEGFAAILTQAAGGQQQAATVAGPTGEPVTAHFGLVRLNDIPAPARAMLALPPLADDAVIGIVEMAQASGLALVPPPARDPWRTSTTGTGQLIRAAIAAGAQAVLLGVGGSATHDLGLGALAELGFAFYDAEGRVLPSPIPAHWPALARIAGAALPENLPIRIACDVTNPLLGPRGAVAIYAAQKGLQPADHSRLETESARMAAWLCRHCGQPEDLGAQPGAGAAGGIAFGLMCAAGARLVPGYALVAAWLDLETHLAAADVVITGEGRFDESSFSGKGPGALALRALALGRPVHVFAGQIAPVMPRAGLHLHGITPATVPLEEALRTAGLHLTSALRKAFAESNASG